jgi:coatomer protein complex subunit alpha (xenin)
VDDELELPEDIGDVGPAVSGEEGYFVPPTKGTAPSQVWATKSQLPGDNVAAGSFENAMRLLTDQVGVVNFDPYKSLFMLTFSHSRAAITGIPLLPPLFTYPLRNWYAGRFIHACTEYRNLLRVYTLASVHEPQVQMVFVLIITHL